LLTTNTIIAQTILQETKTDFDPLVNIEVTVELQTIRWLEEPLASTKPLINEGKPLLSILEKIQNILHPQTQPAPLQYDLNMYAKIFINSIEFESPIWDHTFYIYHPNWNATLDVPDDQEFVNITIQLWNHPDTGTDFPCDLSPEPTNTEAELIYSIATGHWTGDDSLKDPSGYGRLSGCDDGTIYQKDDDAELWFTITQTDYDHDGIPYWIETTQYGTNPEQDNTGDDTDNDTIPIEWEYFWGYDPLTFDNHTILDDDADSLTNYEEYLTYAWQSDPFRKDIFVELDIMGVGPNNETSTFPDGAGDLIKTAFSRQNIIYHLDNGTMGGHDIIPFQEKVNYNDLNQIYQNYFLHNNNSNWRRGVFHYGVVVYSSQSAAGYMYRPNAYQISTSGHEKLIQDHPDYRRDIVYGSAYMHELGHTLGFSPIPGHNQLSGLLGLLDYIRCLPYRSCMNYGYMYIMVDYSDGSRRSPDLNDWNPSRMRFDYFERDWGL
jgi:hypothetical protein